MDSFIFCSCFFLSQHYNDINIIILYGGDNVKKELLTAEGIKKDLYKHFFSKIRDILLAIL